MKTQSQHFLMRSRQSLHCKIQLLHQLCLNRFEINRNLNARIESRPVALLFFTAEGSFLAEHIATLDVADIFREQAGKPSPKLTAILSPDLRDPYKCVFTGLLHKIRSSHFGLQGRRQTPIRDHHQQRTIRFQQSTDRTSVTINRSIAIPLPNRRMRC